MSSNESPMPHETAHPKQKMFLMRATKLFVVLFVVYFIYWLFYSSQYVSTDNAYVNGHIVPVTAQTNGTVAQVLVNDTRFVHAGDTLVRLDTMDHELAVEQAQANLEMVLRQTQQLYIKAQGLKATTEARKLALKQASLDLQRRTLAVKVGGVSKEELTHAQNAYNTADHMLIAALANWQENSALIDGSAIKDHPQVIAATARLKEAYLGLLRSVIKAPVSGIIAKREVEVGQVVSAGTFLMAIVPLNDVWVDANFKERQLGEIKEGQSATLTADLYGTNLVYHGRVLGLSGGTGSTFSLLPAQNATGNWIKVVQRLPVRIALDPKELEKNPLRVGLSMEVSIDLASKRKTLANGALSEADHTDIYSLQKHELKSYLTKWFARMMQSMHKDPAPTEQEELAPK